MNPEESYQAECLRAFARRHYAVVYTPHRRQLRFEKPWNIKMDVLTPNALRHRHCRPLLSSPKLSVEISDLEYKPTLDESSS